MPHACGDCICDNIISRQVLQVLLADLRVWTNIPLCAKIPGEDRIVNKSARSICGTLLQSLRVLEDAKATKNRQRGLEKQNLAESLAMHDPRFTSSWNYGMAPGHSDT